MREVAAMEFECSVYQITTIFPLDFSDESRSEGFSFHVAAGGMRRQGSTKCLLKKYVFWAGYQAKGII